MRKRWRGGAADVTSSSEEKLGNPVRQRMSAFSSARAAVTPL